MTDPVVALKVFLCHASEDKADIRKLHERLLLDGCTPWFDEADLLPGQDWASEIKSAVRSSDVVLVCLSRKSVTKHGFVQKELRLVLDAADEKPPGTTFAIPVRLEPCEVPERLNHLHWVDLFSEDGYERLLRALNLRRMNLGRSFDADRPLSFQLMHRLPPSLEEVAGQPRTYCLVGDESEFASDLKDILESTGARQIPRNSQTFDVAETDLVLVVRGKHFSHTPDKAFYKRLSQYVLQGGVVFATPFVSWEVRRLPDVATLFPFTNREGAFAENQLIRVVRRGSWDRPFKFIASCERLEPNPGTVVLMWAEQDLPLLGCAAAGLGIIYYLNCCQHVCGDHMQSPLRSSSALKAAVLETFNQIGSVRSLLEFYKDKAPALKRLPKSLFLDEAQKKFFSSAMGKAEILSQIKNRKRKNKKQRRS